MVWTVDAQGWLTGMVRRPSPHHNERPALPIDLLVIHAISLPACEFGGPHIEALFLGTLDPDAHPSFASLRGLRVSAHFVIDRVGRPVQYVACSRRAWHAGVSHHAGRDNCNDFSIGIELEGCDSAPYSEAQYATLIELVASLRAAYPAITVERIVGHNEIAPGRKSDPGPRFDWGRLDRPAH